DQQRIFEEFTQLRNPARTLEKGVGLGLSICRQLQHLLEYPSGVESEPGQGATFWVRVPLGEWHPEPAAVPSANGTPLHGRVLRVENDLANRGAMETLLRNGGVSVTSQAVEQSVLATGVEGIAGTDLLLSDYHLEGPASGLELITSLREQGMYAGATALIAAGTSNDLEAAAPQADVTVIYKP